MSATVRLRGASSVLVACLLCACGSRNAQHDVGADAAADSRSDSEVAPDLLAPDLRASDVLPPVTPQGKQCAEIEAPQGKQCIPAGFFALDRSWAYASTPDLGHAVPTYLDAYLIDTHEVTVGDYAAFVQSGSAPPPPDLCGLESSAELDGFPPYQLERSGWTQGKPDPARLDHPVMCVTRGEARAYCAAHGGQLPSAVQWLRAHLGAWPDYRDYPWGNDYDCETGKCDLGKHPAGTHTACLTELCTEPVGSHPKDTSVHGVKDLAGSVSEYLRDCDEPTPQMDPAKPYYLRPEPQDLARCNRRVIIGGASWRTTRDLPWLRVHKVSTDMASTTKITTVGLGYLRLSYTTSPGELDQNDLRSWHLGFRCVYELP